MAKKSNILLYIIIGLLLIISISLYFQYIKNKIFEGATSKGANDDFTVSMNVRLADKNGRLVPFPLGSYALSTRSGTKTKNLDFTMNSDPVTVDTYYSLDGEGVKLPRTITIVPNKTGNSKDINEQDIIPNKFKLTIEFKQVLYKLTSFSEKKAEETVNPEQKNNKRSNYIDTNKTLIINGIGAIYDKDGNPIGNVSKDSSDMENEKIFIIEVNKPEITYKEVSDNKDDLIVSTAPLPPDAIINKIQITFIDGEDKGKDVNALKKEAEEKAKKNKK
jgi:hypothetical protein